MPNQNDKSPTVRGQLGNGVEDYYSGKTESIIEKYGRGDVVHFHIGVGSTPSLDAKTSLHLSQHQMMEVAYAQWAGRPEAKKALHGRVLDAGCGLGGGSIFWAVKTGCSVTAVTITEAHIPLINGYTEGAGVAGQVSATHADIHEVVGEYDCVVTFDASCYFDRPRFFKQMAKVLPVGGWVFIEDVFLGEERFKETFDMHWKTDIGSIQEYLTAASEAGFELVSFLDLTDETKPFWDESARYCEDNSQPEKAAIARVWAKAWEDRAILCGLFAFQRCSPEG